ncbi:MAG: hypothetical protein EHM35_03550 [Planctomycetaceae bacterium]|nr:MAG: hypothetical protein EHM35_03550 [Planctomycetaceae bacterium]
MDYDSYVPKFLSRQEAAEVLDTDMATIDRLIATGILDRYRIRDRWIRVLTGQVLELSELPREWLTRC